MMDKLYLHDVPLSQAQEAFREALLEAGLLSPFDGEDVELAHGLNRITAEPVWARASSPHYHAAAMDGFALRAAETAGASDRAPIILEIGEQAQLVDTGDAMPHWADAVVPIEHVEPIGGSREARASWRQIRLRAALSPWKHVRPMGEDMVATELVLPAGQCLRPVDLGAIAGSGHASVRVVRKPRVAVLPTGSELVPTGSNAQPGEILEYNSLVLGAQVETWGGRATRFPITRDSFEDIQQTVADAAKEHDLVLINAGSSAGSEDFTARVVASLGTVLVHGIAVRPGHPVILGILEKDPGGKALPRKVPVIGVPGYPVSAALTGEIFVEPLIALWSGRPAFEAPTLEATLTRKVHSSLGDDEYLRVTVGQVGERIVATPLSRGAGVITSLVRADGIVRIPSGVQGLAAGDQTRVHLYRSPAEIRRTIVILGSHDLTLDLLAQTLAGRGSRLSSGNLGSLGGLIALRRGEAHLAGSHLLDPSTGTFNVPYVKQYLPNTPVVILGLVERQQGLIVQPGNPKNIAGLEDLQREDVSYVNRQRGAGTRILLDYHLEKLGISADHVGGYTQEEYTHTAVAAAVASQRADCGMGIHAAAAALKLDFIPLFQERYDLIIPLEHYEQPHLEPLLEVLQDPALRAGIDALPGYDTAPLGREITRINPVTQA